MEEKNKNRGTVTVKTFFSGSTATKTIGILLHLKINFESFDGIKTLETLFSLASAKRLAAN